MVLNDCNILVQETCGGVLALVRAMQNVIEREKMLRWRLRDLESFNILHIGRNANHVANSFASYNISMLDNQVSFMSIYSIVVLPYMNDVNSLVVLQGPFDIVFGGGVLLPPTLTLPIEEKKNPPTSF